LPADAVVLKGYDVLFDAVERQGLLSLHDD